MYFFTSDTHFGHENVISKENRPFKNAFEMNKGLIKNWNDTVSEDDHVFHMGDVSFLKHYDQTKKIISQLNGKKHLILGNHDEKFRAETWAKMGFISVHTSLPFHFGDQLAWMSHMPTAREHYNLGECILIHGHLHGKYGWRSRRRDQDGLIDVNVGVELWDYKPVSVDKIHNEIRIRMNE